MSLGNQDNSRQQEWLARIALEFSQVDTPVGERPDLEDLAAMLDNRLDSSRRAQVISHLACDSALYARWQQLLNHHPVWSGESAGVGTPVSLLQQLRERFNVWLLPVSGSALASLALVAFILWPRPSAIDQLYSNHHLALVKYLDGRVETKLRALPVELNGKQVQILAGIHSGLQSVGRTGGIDGIPGELLTDAGGRYASQFGEQKTEYFEQGRWLLMGLSLCRASEDEALVGLAQTIPSMGGKPVFSGAGDALCEQLEVYVAQMLAAPGP
ncbi:hypothetical protein QKW35_07915 [Pontibacterium granulatum]|uniref:hypothetical protein n=1 Tax=Pontibacterium granulatum TaxID=2036029 RepID=UPI00249AD69A|nr:hypothetical protein [Pontibacterium granulatum]MDI3324301.1 hypothetical protein [Pontibacterium granulatum]